MTEAAAPPGDPQEPGPPGAAAAPGAAPPLSMSAWGRRAARMYLLVGALALVAMLVETLLGHPGAGSMIAAVLAAPWSMLVAAFAPPLPRDWPMAAGLAARMLPLALFMLLNAAIIAGIAARSERDLVRPAARVLLLVLLAAGLSSDCIVSSRQVVIAAAQLLQAQVTGDGRFGLVVRSTWSAPTLGGVQLDDFRVGALLETR